MRSAGSSQIAIPLLSNTSVCLNIIQLEASGPREPQATGAGPLVITYFRRKYRFKKIIKDILNDGFELFFNKQIRRTYMKVT